jgi:hypothetical protein
MSKLQVIKKAYSTEYSKCKPDRNGWTYQGKQFCPDTELFKSGVKIETKSVEREYNGTNIKWRPKSLNGLENNNGWIPIKDFNLKLKECHIKLKFDGDEFVALFVSHKNCFVDFDSQQYSLDAVECFIPIVKPKSPHY